MTNVVQGQRAEQVVADELKVQSYKILAQNWKTPICEIDIIAKKDGIIFFVEVKYRVNEEQGSGLEHITPKKLNQIRFASRIWCQNNNWDGDCRVIGAEVSGSEFDGLELVEL